VGEASIDLIWITHPHSDHVGGAPSVLERFQVRAYVDNGLDQDKPAVARARESARARGTAVFTVDPLHTSVPLGPQGAVRASAFVPRSFASRCAADANDCSIGIRFDYCASSVLFLGDAERTEEGSMSPRPVTLLQVGHHGSDTSSSDAFLDALRPRFAVISAAASGEGTNATYCHPRRGAIERLNRVLGGQGARTVRAFDGKVSCRTSGSEHWEDVPTNERLWITARDGDVTLETRGDGAFHRTDPQ
jgi:competence protein ComEC